MHARFPDRYTESWMPQSEFLPNLALNATVGRGRPPAR